MSLASIDATSNRLIGGCTLDPYLGVVEEFRGVVKSEGYSSTVEILAENVSRQGSLVR